MRSIPFTVFVVLAALPLAGCAMFDRERWDIDRYRDERAVDIDRRLSEALPIGQNPFAPPQEAAK